MKIAPSLRFLFLGVFFLVGCTAPSSSGSTLSNLSSSSSLPPEEVIVSFFNYDQTLLEKDVVAYDGTALYRGATPIGPAKAEYTYTFSGWNAPLDHIKENCDRYARFEKTKAVYSVKFLNYDGTLLQESQINYGEFAHYDGELPIREKDLAKTYVFKQWDKDPATTPISYDTLFIARFAETENSYNIRFHNWDYSLLYETKVPYDGTAMFVGTEPSRLADLKYQYSFSGWDQPLDHIHSDKDIVAEYSASAQQYQVVFSYQDGTTPDGHLAYTYHQEVTLPQPTYADHLFLGWEYNGILVKDGPWSFTENVTLLAHWVQTTYQLTLDYNYEDKIETLDCAYGADYQLPIPARTGYRFSGWYNGAQKITDGHWTFEKDIQLKAMWTINEYQINYDYGYGGITATQKVKYGATYTLVSPTRIGYVFAGWYNQETLFNETAYYHESDLTLTAHWTANSYTLTLDTGGGSFVDSTASTALTVTYGSLFTLPLCQNTTVGDFVGWFYQTNTRITDQTGAALAPWAYTSDVSLVAAYAKSITNKVELANIDDVNGKYRLEKDLDLSDSEWTPIPTRLAGEFDGQGHTISGINISGVSTKAGLFAGFDGSVKNLTLKNCHIQFAIPADSGTTYHLGIFAGEAYGAAASHMNLISSTIDITAPSNPELYIGGFFGKYRHAKDFDNGQVDENCSFGNNDLITKTNSRVGGLVGFDDYYYSHHFIDCQNKASVKGYYAGGIVGLNEQDLETTNVQNYGSIEGTVAGGITGGRGMNGNGADIITLLTTNYGNVSGSYCAGGIAGYYQGWHGKLNKTGNAGAITGQNEIGGLVGRLTVDEITNCYNTGNLINTKGSGMAGGMAGELTCPMNCPSGVAVTSCYNTGDIRYNQATWNSNAGNGGLFGKSALIHLKDCLSACSIVSPIKETGNLIGSWTSGVAENCYYQGSLSGVDGVNLTSNLALGSEIGDLASFTKDFFLNTIKWDPTIWNLESIDFANQLYPTLRQA